MVSKAVVVYGSSVITMVLGSLLFVASIRLKIPWTSEGLQDIFMEGMYGSLIAGEHYWSYVFLCALQMGMLAGTLSLAASFLSMFVSNKMLILITYFNTADIIGISWKGLVQRNADISDLESVFDGCTVLSYSLWL